MTDAEIRGTLLKLFYDLRHNAGGWVPTSDINVNHLGLINNEVVGSICQQMADVGLINWNPLTGQGTFIEGNAQITGRGVDVVEGARPSPIRIVFPGGPPIVQLVPTHYPDQPDGPIDVPDALAIDKTGGDFRELCNNLSALIDQLRRSNAIAGDLRDQLIAEMRAGFELLEAPKPSRTQLYVLLFTPLKYLGKKAADVAIGNIATRTIELLGRLAGLW
jgi:hypothetical protein